jgi:peptidyl-prolyl cis-trans isomerase C
MASTASALHILVKHKEQAEDIIKQLNKGAKFHVLAKKYSTCPSGKKAGGSLGEFAKGTMVPAFDKVVFSKEVLTPHLVKTKFGWHIIKILYRT